MTETINLVVSICGLIGGLGTAGAVIWRVIKPALQLKDRVDAIERKLSNAFEMLNALAQLNHTQSLSLVSLINHMIYGNSIDALKKTRHQMQRDLLHAQVHPH